MDDTIRNCLILIPALPLSAAVLVAVLGAKVLRGYSHWPFVLSLVASFVCSLILLLEVAQQQAGDAACGVEQFVMPWYWVDVGCRSYLNSDHPSDDSP